MSIKLNHTLPVDGVEYIELTYEGHPSLARGEIEITLSKIEEMFLKKRTPLITEQQRNGILCFYPTAHCLTQDENGAAVVHYNHERIYISNNKWVNENGISARFKIMDCYALKKGVLWRDSWVDLLKPIKEEG